MEVGVGRSTFWSGYMNDKVAKLKLGKVSKPYKTFYWSRYYEEDTGFVFWKLNYRVDTQIVGISKACHITEDRRYMAMQVRKARRELKEFVRRQP